MPATTTKTAAEPSPWDLLAAPFPQDEVERLPKQLRKDDQDKGRCERPRSGVCADEHPCGGWHARALHLSYVGHAGVTMRLNSVDPTWYWEPMALTPGGTPLFTDGGLWIRLTVNGATRIGFGDAGGKSGTNAVKEIIGDAIRNAAMRFGVGTYLWSKSEAAQVIAAGGDPDADATPVQPNRPTPQQAQKPSQNVARIHTAMQALDEAAKQEVRNFAFTEWGPDWTPAVATDEQTDAVVALAKGYAQQDEGQSPT